MPGVSFQSLADGVGHRLCLAIDSKLGFPACLKVDPSALFPF